MYVQPNTTITMLSGVPLDNTYENTIFFGNAEAQRAHFLTYANRTFDKLTYQRVNSGVLRVASSFESIFDYNYMMFQNTAYGDKWFYAFVNSVDYINDATCQVNYEIDVMQTYFFDHHLQDCFVERETPFTDEIGENTAPEPVDLGSIICTSSQDVFAFQTYSVVAAIANSEGGA